MTYVDIHVLRNFPPSNLNRDDRGSPKTAKFGGYERLRISSQCLKRMIRMSDFFQGLKDIPGAKVGFRTQCLPSLVLKALEGKEILPGVAEGIQTLLSTWGGKNPKAASKEEDAGDSDAESEEGEGKEDSGAATMYTKHLLLTGQDEVDVVAKFVLDNQEKFATLGKGPPKAPNDASTGEPVPEASTPEEVPSEDPTSKKSKGRGRPAKAKPNKAGKESKPSKALLDGLRKSLEEELAKAPLTVDVALFGRFLTSDDLSTENGSIQVAHAISTQENIVEDDYFTAVDDLSTTAGAGFLDRSEFASNTMYSFASCNVNEFTKHRDKRGICVDHALAGKVVAILAHAMAQATPSGKKNSTAPYTVAEYVEVIIRDAPLSLVDSFRRPVKPSEADGDVMDASVKRMVRYRNRIEKAFDLTNTPEQRFVFVVNPDLKDEDFKGTASECLVTSSMREFTTAIETAVAELGKV